jgi:small subunit ribosomal protein S2
MNRNFEGILNIEELPAALIVIDVKNEEIAVAEANRLNIPVIGLVDTNSDPTPIQHPIPGNDDAVKSIRIIVESLVDAIASGLEKRELKQSSKVSKSVTPDTTFEQEGDVEVTLPEGYQGEE